MTLPAEWLQIAAVASVLVLATAILLATRNRYSPRQAKSPTPEDKKEESPTSQATPQPDKPTPLFASVSKQDLQTAEDDLRILSVEKEIVSYALTRLYEAQAEGKITDKDKEKLLGKYKQEMNALEKQVNNKQMIVRLHELETTQADLIKLFQEKFDELNRNIETIRSTLGLAPEPQRKAPEPAEPKKESEPPNEKAKEEPTEEAREKASPKPKAPPKSKAEERVEAIQQEVLKILERLEKQDAEG